MTELREVLQAKRRSSARRSPGQALVEMALVAMILMTIVFGVIDFGIYMYRYVQAANCVRESARRAVVRDPSYSNPPYCIDAGLTPTASADPNSLDAGDEFTATIDIDHNWLALYIVPGMGPSIPLKATTSMRMEPKIN